MVHLSYGMNSQKLPLIHYFKQEEDVNGRVWEVNKALKTPVAHNVLLGYEVLFAEYWRVKFDMYYQYLQNIAVDSLNPTISYMHYGAAYNTNSVLRPSHMITMGSQHKIGGDISLEKYFALGYYGVVGVSYVNVLNKTTSVETQFTAPEFGAAFTSKLAIGKEFMIGPIRRNKLRLDFRFIYCHDQYTIPIDTLATQSQEELVYAYHLGFSEQMPDYWRLDLGISFDFHPKKNNKIQHHLALEILNLANTQNIAYRYYDKANQEIRNYMQLPVYFDLLYRLRF